MQEHSSPTGSARPVLSLDGAVLLEARQGDSHEIIDDSSPVIRSLNRVFDHMDNGENPLFSYDWPLADRHIEKLGLSVWQPSQTILA